MTSVSTLTVRLYNEPIGTLTQVGGERTLFAFADTYAKDSDRATLSLSFKDAFGQLLTDFKPYRTKLMPFFSNLLPEGHLRCDSDIAEFIRQSRLAAQAGARYRTGNRCTVHAALGRRKEPSAHE